MNSLQIKDIQIVLIIFLVIDYFEFTSYELLAVNFYFA